MEKFFDYFDERYRNSVLNSPVSGDGPVITISRETGCDAREIAANIVEKLNVKFNTDKWRWVDKDIIYSTARELNIDTQRIENYYEGIKLSNLSEMIMAFSGGFVSDLRVKKAIKDVVLAICKEGHVVIVGRGGVSIANAIKDSLHVRLVAPFLWRVENVMRKKEMTFEVAEKYVLETDEKRRDLMMTFLDKKTKCIESMFDIMLNRKSFSIAESAEFIACMYEGKVIKQPSGSPSVKSVI